MFKPVLIKHPDFFFKLLFKIPYCLYQLLLKQSLSTVLKKKKDITERNVTGMLHDTFVAPLVTLDGADAHSFKLLSIIL